MHPFQLTGNALRIAQTCLIVCPAFILFGYNQSGVGPLTSLQSWVHTFPALDTLNVHGAAKAHNSTIKGVVIACFQIGALIGSFSCMSFGDTIGRLRTIFIGAVCTALGQILQVTSGSIPQFVVGRLILGAGVGQLSVTVPIWVSECSTAQNRGRSVVITGIFISLGFTLCNWIDFAFSKLPTSTMQWRAPLILSFIPSIVIMICIWFFPESPRWLVRVNRLDEAASTLSIFKGTSPSDDSTRTEISQIQHSFETTQTTKSLFTILTDKHDKDRLLYRFLLCFILQFFQQMSGGNVISVYASTIFESSLRMSPDMAKILASCALTWKFLSCFIAFYSIDRLGRRPMFITSGIGMSLCMIAMAITTSLTQTKNTSIASAIFIFLFNLFYPIGFLGGNFLYCTEVAPVQLRNSMNAVSTANHWLWAFVIVMITPVALDTIGWRYYVVYAVISACIPVAIYFFYPETMGRNLEQLDRVFRDAESPLDIVAAARRLPVGDLDDDVLQESKEKEECVTEHKEVV